MLVEGTNVSDLVSCGGTHCQGLNGRPRGVQIHLSLVLLRALSLSDFALALFGRLVEHLAGLCVDGDCRQFVCELHVCELAELHFEKKITIV